MANLSNVTIRKKDIVTRQCDHCGAKTLHVGKDGLTCLQCIADNELVGCCTIKMFNRWKDETGKVLTEPRGASL